jgi:hypothetical protein
VLRIGRWLIALNAVLCRVALASAAASNATLPIELTLESCDAQREALLRELLAIEFETLGVSATDSREGVALRCVGDGADLTLSDGWGSEPVHVHVDMKGTPEAERPRLLSLTISELVVETRTRRPQRRASPPAKAPAHEAAPARAPSSRPLAGGAARTSAWLSPALSLRRLGEPGIWLFGGALSGEFALGPHVHGAIAVDAEFGSTSTALADVSVSSWGGACGLYFATQAGNLGLAVGPMLELGRLKIAAKPTAADARGSHATALWGGPLLAAQARYRFTSLVFVQARLGAGVLAWTLRGASSDGRPLLDISGAFAAATLGLGLAF